MTVGQNSWIEKSNNLRNEFTFWLEKKHLTKREICDRSKKCMKISILNIADLTRSSTHKKMQQADLKHCINYTNNNHCKATQHTENKLTFEIQIIKPTPSAVCHKTRRTAQILISKLHQTNETQSKQRHRYFTLFNAQLASQRLCCAAGWQRN